jgi:succinate dehydrogenase / fumarate reductase, cytochrome b subunit
MDKNTKHLKNKLGIWGWLGGGRYGAERYAYTLHRLTGLGILAYFILHIFVTGSRIGGAHSWETSMANFENWYFKLGEFLVFLAFAYHALNGLRLGLTELGFLMGKPTRPLYPYRSSVMRQRPVLIVLMILAAILMIAGGADFYLLGK